MRSISSSSSRRGFQFLTPWMSAKKLTFSSTDKSP
jgi:hypothetical protein